MSKLKSVPWPTVERLIQNPEEALWHAIKVSGAMSGIAVCTPHGMRIVLDHTETKKAPEPQPGAKSRERCL